MKYDRSLFDKVTRYFEIRAKLLENLDLVQDDPESLSGKPYVGIETSSSDNGGGVIVK